MAAALPQHAGTSRRWALTAESCMTLGLGFPGRPTEARAALAPSVLGKEGVSIVSSGYRQCGTDVSCYFLSSHY